MNPNNVSFGLAFIAGLASFLSPCVLSLVPAYIGYLGSVAVTATGQQISPAGNRWLTLSHGLAFVLGFSLVFIGLGAAASAVGGILYTSLRALVQIGSFQFGLIHIGGIVVILFGLHTMGVIHLPFLEYDIRRQQAPDKRWGYLSSVLMGVFFSAGWSPCVGPVLGAMLTMALDAEGVARGTQLLTAYSLGLGVPFLLAAAGMANVSQLMRRYSKYLRYISIVTGVFLVLVGILLFTDSMSVFARLTPITAVQTAIDENVIKFWQALTGK